MTGTKEKHIFAHENKYRKRFFRRIKDWFLGLKKWQKGLLTGLTILLILIIAVGSFALSKLGLMNRVDISDRELSCVDVDGYVNILLLGVDTRDMSKIEGAGADAIMILSLKEDTGEVKLMSVYRDTYLKMGDQDYYDKITNANRVGGPALMMQSLNQAMDINISKFAVVNFKSVADLVDAVGGITVTVEDYEIQQLNKYTKQTAKNIGKKDYQLVKKAGEQTLEGVQAVSYGRIRKGVGDDYKRTERMRIVLTKVFEKVKTMGVTELNDLLNLMMPQVQTNLSNRDIFTLAARLASFNIQGSAGWPYDVTSGPLDGVSYVFPHDLLNNTVELHKTMFGQEGYEPTDTVITMSSKIAADVAKVKKKKDINTRSKDKDQKDNKSDNKDKNKDNNKDKDKDKDKDSDKDKDKNKNEDKDSVAETPEKEETDQPAIEPEQPENGNAEDAETDDTNVDSSGADSETPVSPVVPSPEGETESKTE